MAGLAKVIVPSQQMITSVKALRFSDIELMRMLACTPSKPLAPLRDRSNCLFASLHALMVFSKSLSNGESDNR